MCRFSDKYLAWKNESKRDGNFQICSAVFTLASPFKLEKREGIVLRSSYFPWEISMRWRGGVGGMLVELLKSSQSQIWSSLAPPPIPIRRIFRILGKNFFTASWKLSHMMFRCYVCGDSTNSVFQALYPMFFVLMWGCNWMLFHHGWFCSIGLNHLIGRKSLHFENNSFVTAWIHTGKKHTAVLKILDI